MLLAFDHRRELFSGGGTTVRAVTVIALVVLGWALARQLARAFAPSLFGRMDPGTAGTVGFTIRLTGGALAGSIEGIVGSLGLFYTTLVSGADRTMVPNSVILQLAVVPLREPERVETRARFDASMSPSEVERRLASAISVPTRYPPDITLEELDRDEVVVRIAATPLRPADGAQLAAEVLAAVRESDADGTANVDGNGGRPPA